MAQEKKKVVTRKEVTVSLPVVKAPGWLQGFVDFIREQGVVSLAVGLILGLAAKSLVDSFVANFVNPVVGVILGGNNLAHQYLCLERTEAGLCTSKIGFGQFFSDFISFVIMALIVYLVVKKLKLDKLDKPKTLA